MLKKLRSPFGCLLVSGLLFIGTMVGLFVLALRRGGDPFLAEVTRADGVHRLRLLKTQAGPFEYSWKPPVFQSFLPLPGPRVPPITISLNGLERLTNTPGQTFLFRTVDAQGRYASPPGIWPEFDFVESTGFVFSDRIGMPDYPRWGAYALTRCNLPRRDKELRIRVKESSAPGYSQDMTIPNPCYRDDFPVWQADTLPAEKTIGPLTVQLKSCEWLYGRLNPEWMATSTDASWTNPQFQHTLEDATGNMGETLSPFEPVWKLRTSVYRSTPAEFPSADCGVLKKLPILAPGTVQALDQKLQVAGLEFRVLCIAGAGIVRVSNGQFTAKTLADPASGLSTSSGSASGQNYMEVSRSHPFVWIEHPNNLPHGQRVEVQFTQAGQRIAASLGHIGTGDKSYIVAELPVSTGTSEVDLTVALNRPEAFEFFVTPPAAAREEVVKPPSEK